MTRPISPSQMGSAGRCGWAWENVYNRRMKPAKVAVYLLKGTVTHRALEQWALNHSLDLVELTKKAWLEALAGSPAHYVVTQYAALADKAVAVKEGIAAARPDIKNVAATKDWKSHPVNRQVYDFDRKYAEELSEDKHDWASIPLPGAYDDTLVIAKAYQERYRDSPESLITEFKYNAMVDGLALLGIIDDIRLVISSDGEPIGYGIIDYKTYTKEPHLLKDWLQLTDYYIVASTELPKWLANHDLPYNPDFPILVGLDLVSLLKVQLFRPTDTQVQRALAIHKAYDNYRSSATHMPNFKGDCDRCEWYEDCLGEVNLDLLELEVA